MKQFKAFALDYQADKMNAPIISALGVNELAKAMYRQAKRTGIPVVFSDEIILAIKHCEINQEVPADAYQQIAEIFNKYSIE